MNATKARTVYGPATSYCNAGGPGCTGEPVLLVTTAVPGKRGPIHFRDRMCVDHGRSYFDRLAAGDPTVISIARAEQ